MDLYLFTQAPLEDSGALAHICEWHPHNKGWICRTRTWHVVVNASEPLDAAQMGHETTELLRFRPGVRHRTRITIDGPGSGEAIGIAVASAQKAAFRLGGAVYDPQLDALIIPLSEGPLSALEPPSPASA